MHLSTILCKNKRGFFAKGRKVIDIKFTCNREAVVTTADSRIRYIDLNTAKQKFKYKGHKNNKMNIRTAVSGDLELIMSASEDGKVYVWQNMEQEDPSMTPSNKIKDKSSNYESFYATTNNNDVSKTPTKKDRASKAGKSG